jgi:DNA replication protein DnaC
VIFPEQMSQVASTVGKSHVLAALGYELILSGHAVLWMPTSTLVQRLLAAKRDLRLPQELAKLDKYAGAH